MVNVLDDILGETVNDEFAAELAKATKPISKGFLLSYCCGAFFVGYILYFIVTTKGEHLPNSQVFIEQWH